MATAADDRRAIEAQERAWWLRTVAVFLSPTAVFAGLRDDSDDAARARQEPVAALVVLAGIAAALGTPVARRMMNLGGVDGAVVAVWAWIAGVVWGAALYWLFGMLVHGAVRLLGSQGTFRRSRHLLAFAVAPVALSLLVYWPVRIAVYGNDLFRTGGRDYGNGDAAFGWIWIAFLAWALVLLLIGVRAVHGWSVPRALAAIGVAAALPVLLVAGTTL
jgi:hypothetical protein